MTLLFTRLAALFLNLPSLGGLFYDEKDWEGRQQFQWLEPIAEFLDSALVPVIIVVGALGAIWIIILGVNLARAESSDKAAEAKKRLINVIIALVAVILLVFLLAMFIGNAPDWFDTSENMIFDDEKKTIINSLLR